MAKGSDTTTAIGTLDGFDPYGTLNGLVGGGLDLEEIRDATEARVQEAARAVPLRPGIASFLHELDMNGVRRALVSSDRSEWLVTHLERLGWPDGWAAMVCADGDATRAKPNPHLYEAALEVVYQEVVLREQAGEQPQEEEYRRRFPYLADRLAPLFEIHLALRGSLLAQSTEGSGATPEPARTIPAPPP